MAWGTTGPPTRTTTSGALRTWTLGHTGADVGLVTDAPPTADRALHVRAIERWSSLRVVRALDAEDQLRPADALVAFGARARRLIRFVPGRLRGQVLVLNPDIDAAEAERSVRAATRAPADGHGAGILAGGPR